MTNRMASRPPWALAAAVAAGGFVAALLGILLTRGVDNVATLWVANAVLLAALVVRPRADWALLAAAFAGAVALANLSQGDAPALALGFGLVNAGEALVAALLLGRLPGGGLLSLRTMLRFMAAAGLAAPALGAAAGTGLVHLAVGADPAAIWPGWIAADALGNLSLTPLLLALGACVARDLNAASRPSARALLAGAWPIALTTAVTLLVFVQASQPLAFLILPGVFVATYRLGIVGASLSVLIVAVVGSVATMQGSGPMSLGAGSLGHRMLVFQLLVATALACALPIAALASERRSLETRLRRAAETDALTGLANRARLLDALAATMAEADRTGAPVAVCVVDIDHFKAVNDTHGHAAGDAVLARVAQTMAAALRPGDLCARMGGEEFLALLPGAGVEGALAVSERLRAAVATAIAAVDGRAIRATVSVGVAARRAGEGADTLLARADRALYAAKAAGRNRVALAA